MKPPCEIIVNKMLPHIRANMVRILIHDYNMKQIEVSQKLGITQASVSQYLASVRGRDDAFLKAFPEMENYAKTLAEKVASGENKEGQLVILCELCTQIRGKENFCSYHRGILHLDDCGLCFDDGPEEKV